MNIVVSNSTSELVLVPRLSSKAMFSLSSTAYWLSSSTRYIAAVAGLVRVRKLSVSESKISNKLTS